MARISSYPYDRTVTDNDAWIGTEASNRRTKQFTAKDVATYLNLNAKVNIGGQMSFKSVSYTHLTLPTILLV